MNLLLLALPRKLLAQYHIRRDPIGYARSIGVSVGEHCRFLGLHAGTFGSEPFLVRVGDHVTVTSGVHFVTHDGGVWVFRDAYPEIDVVAPISVGNNVFIGINAIILPGVTIGDNSVVAAGAVVTRDVPSGMIVAGVPARPLKSVDDYWLSVRDRAVHLRSLPYEEKRAYLTRFFAPDEAEQP